LWPTAPHLRTCRARRCAAGIPSGVPPSGGG
jgi:hypothetical protein